MKPRPFNYLRVNDQPPSPRDDFVRRLPVITHNLTEWFRFCETLAEEQLFEYELLTIDCNFRDDQSGPWFPLPGNPTTDNDFLNDPLLRELRWSDRLTGFGPNSGFLIGAFLVAQAAHRDLPCGVAVHSRYAPLILQDMSSAMLLLQILLASGAIGINDNLRKTMRTALELISSYKRPLDGLEDTAVRFRHQFLRRAGVGIPHNSRSIRLLMVLSKLEHLLNIFQEVQSDEELDKELQKIGIEFYDRNGVLDSLDVRSLFFDRLLTHDRWGVTEILKHLPLADVKPAEDPEKESGIVWKFVETLRRNTASRPSPVSDFLRRLREIEGEER